MESELHEIAERRDGRQVGVAELNSRRRQAVRLRDSGVSIAEVARRVGLSRQTVIAAYKSYLKGGNNAVSVGGGGRTLGSGARLGGVDERRILSVLLDSGPLQNGLDGHLWSAELVHQWIRDTLGFELSMRSVKRYLVKWGFVARPDGPASEMPDNEGAAWWCLDEYPEAKRAAREMGAKLRWLEDRRVNLPAPSFAFDGEENGSRRRSRPMPYTVIYLTTHRSDLRWLAYRGRLTANALVSFFEAATLEFKQPLYLLGYQHGPFFERKVVNWLETHQGRICFLPAVPRWFAHQHG
jgi:transposase